MINIFKVHKDAKYICMTAYYGISAVTATFTAIKAGMDLSKQIKNEKKKKEDVITISAT